MILSARLLIRKEGGRRANGFKSLPCAFALLAACLSTWAQNVEPTRLIGVPLQYMQDGAISGCGARIIAMKVRDDLSTEASEVSVNLNANGSALVKAVAYARFAPGATSPRSTKVSAAWAKADGSPATRMLGKAYSGDDGLSLLYATDLDGALSVVKALLDGAPVQVSVTRSTEKGYRIMSGVASMSEPERQQLASCIAELVHGMESRSGTKSPP